MSRFSPDSIAPLDRVAELGFERVRVDGASRLATAIYAGHIFSHVRGFRVNVPGRSGDRLV